MFNPQGISFNLSGESAAKSGQPEELGTKTPHFEMADVNPFDLVSDLLEFLESVLPKAENIFYKILKSKTR